jgi:CheY-like chemotaxis protein
MTKKKILVVDDELFGRQLLEALLMMEGYEVILAQDGFEAIEIAKKTQPDLMLIDVMMPGKNGYEVVEELKLNDSFKDTPMILVTALDDRDSKTKGLNAGAVDYISKPYNNQQIVEKIGRLLL